MTGTYLGAKWFMTKCGVWSPRIIIVGHPTLSLPRYKLLHGQKTYIYIVQSTFKNYCIVSAIFLSCLDSRITLLVYARRALSCPQLRWSAAHGANHPGPDSERMWSDA